jgi:membrane protein implicated in regulation of membrane protease activity
MTETTAIRLVVACGCFSGAFGLSRRWWIGAMAAALAWVYPNYGITAMATFLTFCAAWSFLLRRFTKRRVRPTQSDDIIDAEFEVSDG